MTRVLVADDHPIMLSGVEAILGNAGYEVVARAATGTEALERLADTNPDILILDVHMPSGGGMDVLRQVRSRGDMRPVVLLTAGLNDADLVEALQLNVSGILLKDGAQALLLRCLDDVRGGGRWIDKSLLQRAVELALPARQSPAAALGALADREREVVALVARGLRNREVARELGLSEGTVKVYLYRIYEKLGVTNRTELALLAQEVSRD